MGSSIDLGATGEFHVNPQILLRAQARRIFEGHRHIRCSRVFQTLLDSGNLKTVRLPGLSYICAEHGSREIFVARFSVDEDGVYHILFSSEDRVHHEIEQHADEAAHVLARLSGRADDREIAQACRDLALSVGPDGNASVRYGHGDDRTHTCTLCLNGSE